MRILLLGKTGFIGKNMYQHFLHEDDVELSAPSHEELNVMEERAVFSVLNKGNYDAIINCLDIHSSTDSEYAERRLRMFYNLANHRDLYGKMIYFGSGAEYGRQIPLERVSESDFGRVVPSDSYGFALYQMSEFTLSTDNIYNLRLFGIFGPYEKWERRFISNCICRALLGFPIIMRQNRKMDYLDVSDLVQMTSWATNSSPKMHAYNATSGKSYELLQLAQLVLEHEGMDRKEVFIAKDGYSPEYTSLNKRILQEMGGYTIKPIEMSIDYLFKYYQSIINDIDCVKLLFS